MCKTSRAFYRWAHTHASGHKSELGVGLETTTLQVKVSVNESTATYHVHHMVPWPMQEVVVQIGIACQLALLAVAQEAEC